MGKQVKIIVKNGEKITETLSYKLQFIDRGRLMTSSLSNLVNNLAEEIDEIKCKFGHDNKRCEKCGIRCNGCDSCLEYTKVKDGLIVCKKLCCCVTGITKEGSMKTSKIDLLIHTNLLAIILTDLTCCCKNVLTI